METIRLYTDGTTDVNILEISKNLSRIAENLVFCVGKAECVIPDSIIECPATYKKLNNEIKNETAEDLRAIIVTKKQYNNNYFLHYTDNIIILSLFGWEYLTTLSMNNGVIFFIADVLALLVDDSFHHSENDEIPKPECIYDFGWNKSGVDIGMRSALICPDCMKRINALGLSDLKRGIFEDLKKILNDLGNASKWETDVLDYWRTNILSQAIQPESIRNQVFISYSHSDKDWLERLKVHLKPFERNSVIHIWDDTRIKTGQDWKREIENALNRTKIAVLLVSAHFLASEFITNDELPVLLSAAKDNGTLIMPIILKPCNFEKFHEIAKFQSINPPSRSLIEMNEGEQERFLLNLTRDILCKIE